MLRSLLQRRIGSPDVLIGVASLRSLAGRGRPRRGRRRDGVVKHPTRHQRRSWTAGRLPDRRPPSLITPGCDRRGVTGNPLTTRVSPLMVLTPRPGLRSGRPKRRTQDATAPPGRRGRSEPRITTRGTRSGRCRPDRRRTRSPPRWRGSRSRPGAAPMRARPSSHVSCRHVQATTRSRRLRLAHRQRPRGAPPVGRVVARDLLATGDVDGFRRLVEPETALKLEHDPEVGAVTAVGDHPGAPRSPALRNQLLDIMAPVQSGPPQNAEVHFGSDLPNTLIGQFPGGEKEGKKDTVQLIDLADIEVIEGDMPDRRDRRAHTRDRRELLGEPAAPGPAWRGRLHSRSRRCDRGAERGARRSRRWRRPHRPADRRQRSSSSTSSTTSSSTLSRRPRCRAARRTSEVQGSAEKALDPISEHIIDDFPVSSDVVPATAAAAVAAAEADLNANPRSVAVIAGYTDSTGTPESNEMLSAPARTSVRNLVAPHLQKSAGPVGRGAIDPVGDNQTEAGRRMNRRVVIKVRQPRPDPEPASYSRRTGTPSARRAERAVDDPPGDRLRAAVGRGRPHRRDHGPSRRARPDRGRHRRRAARGDGRRRAA